MLKKVILGAASASALILAMSAYAGSASTPKSNPSHSKKGFYVGAQAGYGYSDIATDNSNDGVLKSETNKGGFDGRVDVGYRFNNYFGLELGGSYLPHSNYQLTEISTGNKLTKTLDQYGVDLMGMGYLPLVDQLYAFGGVGGILVISKSELSGIANNVITTIASTSYNTYLRPKVTAGLGYDINERLAVTVQYNRIFGNKTATELQTQHGVPSINEFTAGVQYTF